MTHTPTPWEASSQYLYADNRPLPIASGKLEWTTNPGGSEHEEAKANAAFIVRAVNAYDDLVAVARILADLETEDCGRKFPTKEQCFAARAALAKAEAK